MRSLLAVLALALTCTPHPDPAQLSEQGPVEQETPTPRTWVQPVAVTDIPTLQLVVSIADDDQPWISTARDEWEISSDDFMDLLVPGPDAWPDDALSAAFAHALCVDVADCDELDHEGAWEAVADEVDAAGLSVEAPGTEGNPWERYATLWLRYVQSDGFFMEDADRADLEDGLLASLDAVADGPVRGPLVLATIVFHPDGEDELVRDLAWELVEEHDDELAIVGMEILLDADTPIDAFDDLAFAPDSELELRRRRLHLEQAAAGGLPLEEVSAALLSHPLAAPSDHRDVRSLELRARADEPDDAWARALVADASECADLVIDDDVRVTVRSGVWQAEGEGSVADCLFGWSWPQHVDDQDVVLTVVR